jgi:hypothetical protein
VRPRSDVESFLCPVHNERSCRPLRTSPSPIANSKKARASIPPDRAFAARCVAGLPAKRTSGLAPADMNGTPSTPAESVPPAFTNGRRRNASRVTAGRRTRIGTLTEIQTPEIRSSGRAVQFSPARTSGRRA